MKKPHLCGIYCIRNKINDKRYIGKSISIIDRLSAHKKGLNKNKSHNYHFQNSWNKYGEENFIFFVLELCPRDVLNEREICWIEVYNSCNSDFGFNKTKGGEGALGVDRRGIKNGMFGKHRSEEFKKNMSDRFKNKTMMELFGEVKAKDIFQKRSKKRKDLYKNGMINPMKGKKRSLESNKKQSIIMSKKEKIQCQHCLKFFCAGNYKKYHGDLCIQKEGNKNLIRKNKRIICGFCQKDVAINIYHQYHKNKNCLDPKK